MSTNQPQLDPVTVSDWVACFNSSDNVIVLSCTLTTVDGSAGITSVGLILNTSEGHTLVSSFAGLSSGSQTANPSLNVAPGGLTVGSGVMAVAQGQCNGHHFFFEEELTISNC